MNETQSKSQSEPDGDTASPVVSELSVSESEGSRPSAKPERTSFQIKLLLVVGALLVLSVAIPRFRGVSVEDRPLPKVAPVPAFSLTERDGRTVTNQDLLGHVWVADFFFTLCTGPCPKLSLRLRSLQEGIREYAGDVKLVSFSVDPTYDQPAVLQKYAERYGAEPDLWWFLTSDDEPSMHKLVAEGFLQAVSRASKRSPVIHSTRFLLIDQEGYIRAWYDGEQAATRAQLLHDIERLRQAPADTPQP